MPRGRLKAVVFDLDGTLVDSALDIAAALNVALGQAGYPPLPLPEITRMVGGGARLLAERGLAASGVAEPDPSSVDRLYQAFETAYHQRPAHLTTLYPGALKALRALHEQGVALGICTNKPELLTRPILEALQISDLFRSIVAASLDLELKPAPAMLRKCLQELGAHPAESAMIGDSAADVGTARSAGVPVILVSHGYTTTPAADLGADQVIDHFDALDAALSKLHKSSQSVC